MKINPAIAEDFLVLIFLNCAIQLNFIQILKYNKFGHYAVHYDHLDPMPRYYDDGWFEYYGNRVGTALLIVKTAVQGGGTIFPLLNLTIQPEPGINKKIYNNYLALR